MRKSNLTVLTVSLLLASSAASARWVSVDPVKVNASNGQNFNRYYYAINNPYRFTDPDGRRATVVNGQIVIVPENAGNPSVTIPNTVGATGVSPNRWFFHDYSVATASNTRNPAAVANAFAHNPAPGPNDYATPNGTLNNVGHLPFQILDFGVNMVRSFTAPSPDATKFTDVTVNYTVAGAHSMEEGFVLQFGKINSDGSITNVSYGEGNAFQQGNWDKPLWLPQVTEVWEKHHEEINQATEGQ